VITNDCVPSALMYSVWLEVIGVEYGTGPRELVVRRAFVASMPAVSPPPKPLAENRDMVVLGHIVEVRDDAPTI
jgi:hypothetical protein